MTNVDYQGFHDYSEVVSSFPANLTSERRKGIVRKYTI